MKAKFALRTLAPLVAILCLVFFSTGCPDSLPQLCPAGTQQAGVFSTTLGFNATDPDQCFYGDGGGAPDASLSASPAAFTSAICSGLDVDGGPLVYLALPAFVRVATLGPGGTFQFVTGLPDAGGDLVTGTSCGCNINVMETITGTLTAALPDASLALVGDAGLPALSGFSGTVIDLIDGGDDAGVPCYCNLPCDLQYSLSATSL